MTRGGKADSVSVEPTNSHSHDAAPNQRNSCADHVIPQSTITVERQLISGRVRSWRRRKQQRPVSIRYSTKKGQPGIFFRLFMSSNEESNSQKKYLWLRKHAMVSENDFVNSNFSESLIWGLTEGNTTERPGDFNVMSRDRENKKLNAAASTEHRGSRSFVGEKGSDEDDSLLVQSIRSCPACESTR